MEATGEETDHKTTLGKASETLLFRVKRWKEALEQAILMVVYSEC